MAIRELEEEMIGKESIFARLGSAVKEMVRGESSFTARDGVTVGRHEAKGKTTRCETSKRPARHARSTNHDKRGLPDRAHLKAGQSESGKGKDDIRAIANDCPSHAHIASPETPDTTLPPIVVGSPSPVFEPKPIDAGKYHSTILRPAIVADGWTSDVLSVRAASVRGLAHQWYGSPRQDDYLLATTETGWLVAGVADGVSAATQSHIASTQVLQYLAGWFAATNPQSIQEIDWKALLEMVRFDLVEKERKMFPDLKQPGRELATTISFAVVVPRTDGKADVVAVIIGDSSCWVLDESGYDRKLGGKAGDTGGISDSSVKALPLLPNEIEPATFVIEPGQVLLIGSDGIGDPLGSGSGEVGKLLSDSLLSPNLPSPLGFARIVDFSRETFDDDRTLVAVRLTGRRGEVAPECEGEEAAAHDVEADKSPVDGEPECTGGMDEQNAASLPAMHDAESNDAGEEVGDMVIDVGGAKAS